ncbi:capsular polysaccharide synthesis protein [Klebsiella pneumoniae]|uniref:capsular polysaccharide synthesis protein n=1 Tax=Klebsiella pneumoniae TaxID=573 RepID=UPI002F96316C|nr:capsular biosynthesis protein [Klebsiella quasipneumoniae]
MISTLLRMRVAILSVIEKFSRVLNIPDGLKLKLYMHKRKIILNSLYDFHRERLNEPISFEYNPEEGSQLTKIWICWLQGEDSAPLIVKQCISNLRKYNSDKYKIIVITNDNYMSYVSIPSVIMRKFNDGIITHTHFSDILRFTLLRDYGGMWIDATYLTLNTLPSIIEESSFFTMASNIYDKKFVPMGRWSGNFIKFPKNNPVPSLMCSLFLDYWKENDKLIDYFLIDYYLELIYEHMPEFKIMIDNNVRIGERCFLMSDLLFEVFNKKDDALISEDPVKIYKLTYKNSPKQISKPNTFYKKYIKQY